MERQTYPVTVFSFPRFASRNRPHRGPDGALTPVERGTVLAPPFASTDPSLVDDELNKEMP